jgi:hypothetical protein
MTIPREGFNTPVESIGTRASHADEDVLRPTPNQEGVEPGGNDLAAMQPQEGVSVKMQHTKRQSLDLANPVHAYLFGFIQTDGHLSKGTRNRGKLQIEVSYRDADVLEKLASVIPYYSSISTRIRSTNFSSEYKSVVLSVYAREFRDELVSLGLMSGGKSEAVDVPHCEYAKADYFRGIIDGDGSLGFTASKFPFIALCTASEKLAVAYELFVRQITGKEKRLARNSRDRVYNITLYKEDAQAVAATLYYEGCISISRKMQVAVVIQSWIRPNSMRRVPQKKFWTDEQDSYILAHTIEESAAALRRSTQSIKMRLWSLHSSNK